MRRLRSLFWGAWWKRILTIAGAGLLALILVAAIVVKFWLIPGTEQRIQAELARNGIHLTYRNVQLSPFRGSLLLKNITLHQTSERSTPLATLSELEIRIDLPQLIWKQALWGEVGIEEGELRIHGEHGDTTIENLTAALDVDRTQLRVLELSGEASFGHRFHLTGRFRRSADVEVGSGGRSGAPGDVEDKGESRPPKPEKPTPIDANAFPPFPYDLSWVEGLAAMLRVEADGGPPLFIDGRIDWDETRSASSSGDGTGAVASPLVVEGTIRGGNFRWRDLPVNEVEAKAHLEGDKLTIPSIKLDGVGGHFEFSGAHDLGSGKLRIGRINSDLDAIAIVGKLDLPLQTALDRLHFASNPSLRGEEILLDLHDPVASKVEIDLAVEGDFTYREGKEDLVVSGLRGRMVYGGAPGFRLEDLSGRINGLQVDARATIKGGDQVGAATSKQDGELSGKGADHDTVPPSSDPVAGTGETLFRAINNLLHLDSPSEEGPSLEVDLLFDAGEEPNIELTGSFTGKSFAWHGHTIQNAKADFSLRDHVFEIQSLGFESEKGKLSGSGRYDITEGRLVVDMLDSTVELGELIRELELGLVPALEAIEFPEAPTVNVDGFELQFGEEVTGRGRITLEAPQGFVLTEEEDELAAQSFRLALVWQEPDSLVVEEAAARVGDLDVGLTGRMSWEKDATRSNLQTGSPEIQDAEPDGTIPPPSPSGSEGAETLVATLKRYLSVESRSEPLRVTGDFTWAGRAGGSEPSDWREGLEVNAEFSGRDYRWKEFSVRRMEGKPS